MIKKITTLLERRFPRSLDQVHTVCVDSSVYFLVFFNRPVRLTSPDSLENRILDETEEATNCRILIPDPENPNLLLIIVTAA